MKRFRTILFLFALSALSVAEMNAQRIRLGGETPYDVFMGVRIDASMPQAPMNAYQFQGGGAKFFVEFQLQEQRVGFGLQIGTDYYKGKNIYYPELDTWKEGKLERFMHPSNSAVKIPISLYTNYYFVNESIKPYVGIGCGVIHGGYDETFLLPDSIMGMAWHQKFHLNRYAGWQVGGLAKLGVAYALQHKHLFGLEGEYYYYLKREKLIAFRHYGVSLYYAYIFD